MKIKRPESPFQASPEPLESEAQNVARKEFADTLSQLEAGLISSGGGQSSAAAGSEAIRTALEQIANRCDLSNPDDATQAVKQSAGLMIQSRLSQAFKQAEQGQSLVENLSQYIAGDPLLKPKLLGILKKIKSNGK
jgi:hypothetical protein